MAKVSETKWEDARALREAGASFAEVAASIGVSAVSVFKRARKGGWGDGKDVAEVIRQKVNEKVNGVANAVNHKKRAEALSAAADRAALIIEGHKRELDEHRATFPLSTIADDFDKGKSAKISMEVLRLRQDAERKAWGLEEKASTDIVCTNPRPKMQDA